MSGLDFSEDIMKATDNDLKRIAERARELSKLDMEIEEKKIVLKAMQKKYSYISEVELPDLMSEVGMQKFVLDDGVEITIRDCYRCSITNKNRQAIMEWLNKVGADEIIKNEVVATFQKGENEAAHNLLRELESQGLDVEQLENVNTATFKALIKEMADNGGDVPYEDLSVYHFKKTFLKQ